MSQPNQLERSSGVTNPLVLLEAAIKKGIKPEELGKLLDLQERWERNRAAEQYAGAITQFQAKMPAVLKVNPVKNKAGQIMYHFADFADVMDIVQPIASECGIVITFDTEPQEKRLKVTCNIRVGTHVEHAHAYVSVPNIPNANDTQQDGGAIAFGKRYAVCAGLGIRIKGEDNDARFDDQSLTAQETEEINSLIEACRLAGRSDAGIQQFWDWIFKETDTTKRLAEMPRTDLGRAKVALQEWLKKYGKKGGGQ